MSKQDNDGPRDRFSGLKFAAAQIVCGFLAGGLVFAIEAFDRLRVLRGNYDGPMQALRLAILLGATVLFIAFFAIAIGISLAIFDAFRRWLTEKLPAALGRWRGMVGLVASAAVVAVFLRACSVFAPWAVEGPTYRLIRRIDSRLTSLGFIADHPKLVFLAMLSTATLALMALFWWLSSARGARARFTSVLVAIVAVLLTIALFAADSRVEFTRYEFMFHVPLEVISSFVALVAVGAALRTVGAVRAVAFSRLSVVAAAAIALFGVGSVVYGAVAMDASQNVKALFWSRSIIARRVFSLARALTDRDGDGFSATFGGGDLDDNNPQVHPMLAEIPGNGIDDNCIGGDLAGSTQPRGELFISGVAAGPPGPRASGDGKPRDVLILSVDCLRADHLGCYGYRKATSPNIDAFAAKSLLLENTYAQGTNTGHSFTSMYRSSYGDDIFDDRVPTFAQLLADAGYEARFVNAVRTDAWLNANRWGKYKELLADFELDHENGDRIWNAAQLTDRAIEVLDAQDHTVPQLTWVHYFDCHRPRRRHAEHDFGRSASGVFDSNVAFVDEHMGRLLAHLEATGALDRTLVFIIADHGEAFMEHGAQDHSNKPYNNNTLVPLIVHAPGVRAARFPQPCGLIDVGPTVMGYTGMQTPPPYRGLDLLAATALGALPMRPIVSETPRNLIESSFYTWALVDWPNKVLWDVRSNTIEVFDLSVDPGEMHNLADRDPSLAVRMRALLGEWLDRETARTGAVGPGDEGLEDSD